MKSNGKNFVLKVKQNGHELDRVRTHSKRALLTHLRSIKWQDEGIKTYLRVSYGMKLDNFGKKSTFYNDGWYDSERDLKLAYEAFSEVD